ncbi:hypothetical protein KAFR_0G01160 [Kazachstania africana CBS 2517]|uniref:Arf-GAP domain-containing protein n=1 Tax=Kazachstania africana (strain ATCC 22294 / BCRC 22015 / CBS 2517 / CECT 1963 / NBRC 1671 / NRRL Y-8276) TaxID=1071382 RepID=H2AXP9_KAZAF|nr:hypothetical protein KAFR_0G01160 [Kazachstania africana CBS 2517]CCF59149.1 hypothetical protein KAFR_0G01160 [Kazachstania africana CBS 2517]
MALYEGSIFVTKEKVQEVFDKLRSQDSRSRFCFDCGAEDAAWVSVPFAVMLCLSCSNIHRTMDVGITYVKSSIIDQWTVNNLKGFKYGGNQKAYDYFTLHSADKLLQASIKEKYTNEIAAKYRHHIDSLVKRDTTEHPFEISVATKSFANMSSESLRSEENNNYGSGNDLFTKDWGEPLKKVNEARTLNAHILQEPKRNSILSSNRKPTERISC